VVPEGADAWTPLEAWEGALLVFDEAFRDAIRSRVLSETPPGMVLVPREPTTAMIHAGGYALQEHAALTMEAARIAWDAMVEAAEKGEGNE
jgi:hypothetical protein